MVNIFHFYWLLSDVQRIYMARRGDKLWGSLFLNIHTGVHQVFQVLAGDEGHIFFGGLLKLHSIRKGWNCEAC